MNKRSEYLEAAKDEFRTASRDDLLKQIAFLWRKVDRMNERMNVIREDRDAAMERCQ